MYVVTNRQLKADEGDLGIFSSTPNIKGSNELRIVKVVKTGNKCKATLVKDELEQQEADKLKEKYNLNIDTNKTWYTSLSIACELFDKACKEKKHILLYVHGYNNNLKDIVNTAEAIEKTYKNVLVIPFSWPARGGGAMSGTANYIDDKRDARASAGALDRVVGAIRDLHQLLVESQSAQLWQKAEEKFPDNPIAAREEYVKLHSRVCKVSLNLLCHSMGNYVLKYATLPSGSHARKLTFDNVCLVAADANNKDHEKWVDAIDSRIGSYVAINENDFALGWSRRKPGEEQLPRLGHHLKGLNSENATYIDVTSASHVGNDHGYFQGDPVIKNDSLRAVFACLFQGERPESRTNKLKFHNDVNVWRIK